MAALDNSYAVTVTATDSAGNATQQAVTVAVTSVNESPLFTSSASFSAAENGTSVGTVVATDPDGGAISYSIVGGTDAAKFAISAAGGVLTFVSAQNYEAPGDADANGIYAVTVRASDGANTTDQAISVTLTNVNESPVIGAGASQSIAEGGTAVANIAAADPEGAGMTYAITGGADAAKFAIDAGGNLSFLVSPNYESPSDSDGNNVYQVTVSASDGTNTSVKAMAITVTNTNEAPDITSGGEFSMSEGGTAVGTVTAVDPEGDAITFTISGGADAAKFDINPTTGAISFKVAPDFENPTDA
ncbi:MAG: cadherin domain-containing protein [Thiothrix sp.]|uniref:cadherin repeat domain-containing protein n=1 Tax=Thiothrix sp. TaxID=1032 RepID=UPI002607F92D|nr:cadherin domain-containing protein [Thiothrix sp.]MDD5395234.1 cadherin domain-containing protein [Thiothrix sp.]